MTKQKTGLQTAKTKRALSPFIRKRLYEAGFLVILTLALYSLLALMSYDPTDPSWSAMSKSPHQEIVNSAGQVGAYLADFLYYSWGYFAFIWPFLGIYLAWRFLKDPQFLQEVSRSVVLFRATGFIFILIAGCGLSSLDSLFTTHDPMQNPGGIFGILVAQGFTAGLHIQGTSLTLYTLLLIGLSWVTGLSLLQFIELIGRYSLKISQFFWQKISILGKILYTKLKQRAKISQSIIPRETHTITSITPEQRKTIIGTHLSLDTPLSKDKKEEKIIESSPEKGTATSAIKIIKPQPIRRNKINFSTTLPSLDLLDKNLKGKTMGGYTPQELETVSREVEQHLLDFGIQADVVAVHPGPVITRFELQLAAGIKVSKLSALAKDLARSLSVTSVRVVEVIPGKTVVGIELPNQYRETVYLSDVLSAEVYQQAHSPLSLALGVDISGHPMIVDLAKMPHLLVAGTTGSGKSVGINAMILSLLFKAGPEQVRLIMIDPKMLELSVYDGIPHLLAPVVTDMKEAASSLRWCVVEMERRYRLMAALGVRNLVGYNNKIAEALASGEVIPDPLWKPTDSIEEIAPALESLPYIVVIIDELADMMMVVGKKVEQLIARIAQKARAAGIHLILATQRPSVDVLTGLIKSNIPTRISFQVSSKIDSRTILDQQGAEQLLGHGDMLYLAPGSGAPLRVHGAFVDDKEVHRVAMDWRTRGEPDYLEEITKMNADNLDGNLRDEEGEIEETDPLYDEAVEFVLQTRKASISAVQRRLKIGYNRAARLIEEMERTGLVGPLEGGIRDVLVKERINET